EVDVDPTTPLLWVIREQVGLTGTKYGCGIAQCGACTVHVNGVPMRSCSVPVSAVGNGKITTIEGLASGKVLHKVQKAWIDLAVPSSSAAPRSAADSRSGCAFRPLDPKSSARPTVRPRSPSGWRSARTTPL